MATSGAQQSGFPTVGTKAVTAEGVLTQPWLYLLSQMWQKLGQTYSLPQSVVFGVQTGAKQVTFYSAATGQEIGYVTLT